MDIPLTWNHRGDWVQEGGFFRSRGGDLSIERFVGLLARIWSNLTGHLAVPSEDLLRYG